jgi:hypothetical protein
MGKKPLGGLLGLLVAWTALTGGCETSKPYNQDPNKKYTPSPTWNTSVGSKTAPANPAPPAADTKGQVGLGSTSGKPSDILQTSGTAGGVTTPTGVSAVVAPSSGLGTPTSAPRGPARPPVPDTQYEKDFSTSGMPARTPDVVHDVPAPSASRPVPGMGALPMESGMTAPPSDMTGTSATGAPLPGIPSSSPSRFGSPSGSMPGSGAGATGNMPPATAMPIPPTPSSFNGGSPALPMQSPAELVK